MYLKAVNINGFKSFSENTNIDFTNKVNVVVGPNGSGKSNSFLIPSNSITTWYILTQFLRLKRCNQSWIPR